MASMVFPVAEPETESWAYGVFEATPRNELAVSTARKSAESRVCDPE